MTERASVLLRRALACALLAAWVVLSWPELRAGLRDRTARLATLAALAALAAGYALAPLARLARAALVRPPERWFVAGAALASGALTAWVHRGPMNGQVVSGDACMYVAQARALAHLSLGIPVTAPRLAHAAKFLVEGVDGRLHGVFVPGYPLFLAPFVRWDLFLAAALVTSALLTVAHAALARAVLRDVFAARLAVLLLVPSYARAIETADLLSHAFTGSLSALAVAAALRMREKADGPGAPSVVVTSVDGLGARAPSPSVDRAARSSDGSPGAPSVPLAAALGLCVGWVFGSRMLDGFVLAAALAPLLAGPLLRRAITPRMAAVAFACALPFVALVAAQQKAATGSFRRPTTVEYADRSDWPPRCLHLGFGWEVGCKIEHGAERQSFGADGYTPDDALRVVRERTGLHGSEVFGAAAVGVAGFAAVALAPGFRALAAALFPVALTLAYGLFYYGNSEAHGARHVFPAAPFTTALAAYAASRLARWRPGASAGEGPRREGAMLVAFVAFAAVAHPPRWREGAATCARIQRDTGPRVDLRALLRERRVDRGVVIFPDVHSYLVALDPWRDAGRRVIVHDDQSGEQDLRRFHPDLPVWVVLRDRRVLPVRSATPPPGLLLEFERAWPSFQRPRGLAAAIVHAPASGNRVLALFESRVGATLDVPFDLAASGTYTLRLDGYATPEGGRYEVLVDGQRLLTWEGYAPERTPVRGEPTAPRPLAAGPHTFTARCVGRAPGARGYDAVFDALVAEPAQ